MVKRLLMFFGIALGLAGLVWGVLSFVTKEPPNINRAIEQPSNSDIRNVQFPQVNQNVNAVNSAPVKKLSAEELEKEALGQFARDFASRFATYSNQNFASNIVELIPQTQGAARVYLERLKEDYQVLKDEYVGVTSKALVVQWEDFRAGSGQQRVTVSLWRQEERENAEAKTYNQDMVLTLVRQGGEWRVSEILWQEVQ